MLLTGKTVLVVEPERFAAYALEQRLRDLDAHDVVVVHDADEARLRFALDAKPSTESKTGGEGKNRGARKDGTRPMIAIIDFDERCASARSLARTLRQRHVKVVRTASPASGLEPCQSKPPMPTVSKPYDLVEIERAIAGHYGVMI